ncbi:hypothetical protein [Nocardioides sp. SYSU D00065]|uniref:hypothetical protein n=1 Tax=Nocardioides sp. SYSU D00065 TaxID=2817378 RepID=UPI001B3276CB|nr:hypothetical protein [Nocardioides sp. SYSU D00065]
MNTSRPRIVPRLVVSLIAVAGLAACGADDRTDGAGDSPAASSPTMSTEAGTETGSEDAGDTLSLTADASAAGKCAVPSAETLATFDTAFAGTVTSLDDGTATLTVDEWYAGDEAAEVTVEAPSDDLQDLLMAVDFEQGSSYLVSADGDRVTLCGFTAERTPELEAMYAEAFSQ